MPDEPPAAAERVPAALAGPLVFSPFRARRLDPRLVGGAPGATARALGAHLDDPRVPPADPSAALHVHEYRDGDRVVRGVVGTLDLDLRLVGLDDGDPARAAQAALLPHEAVDAGRAERLAAHMLNVGLDPAPLLLLTGPGASSAGTTLADLVDRVVTRVRPRELTDARGRQHRLWAVTDDDSASELATAVRDARLLLADGHHRYAAQLALAARRPPAGDGRMLSMVVDAERHAPALHAIHRVVRGVSLATLEDGWRSRGHRAGPGEPVPPLDRDQVVLVGDTRTSVVTLGGGVDTAVEEAHRVLAQTPGATWYHHHSPEAAVRLARGGDAVALLLPALTPGLVWDAVAAGRVLPPKATSFEPKPPLGMLLRAWRDG